MQKYNLKKIYEWPNHLKKLIYAAVFLITIYFGYLLDISDLQLNLSTIKRNETELKEQIERNLHKEAMLNKDISQYPKYVELLTEWRKQMIKRSDLPELLNQLLKIGSTNHLYFTALSPGAEKLEGSYFKVPIKMTVVGSYHQLAAFISQLANMSWIIYISDFSISSVINKDAGKQGANNSVDGGTRLTADFDLNVYHVPEDIKK